MKLFVYSMREYDELAFFEKFCGEYGVEFGYTTQTPCLENVELAKGYDVVDIITTIMDKPMIDAFHAAGMPLPQGSLPANIHPCNDSPYEAY